MKIKKISRLNGRQREEIRELEGICHAADKTKSKVYLASDQNVVEMPCFFLAYNGDRLIGFLAVYLPTEEEAEIKAFVHPEERNKGCFSKLFSKVKKSLNEAGVLRCLLIHETKSKAALPALEAMKAQLVHSEYLLSYKRTDETGFSNPEGLTLQSKEGDSLVSEELITMHKEIFELSDEDTRFRLKEAAAAAAEHKGRLYSIEKEGKCIGCCAVSFEAKHCCLYDFGIRKEYQRQRHGLHALELIVHELRSDPMAAKHARKLFLHVEGTNQAALSLYTGFGFEVVEQYDYYSISLKSNDTF